MEEDGVDEFKLFEDWLYANELRYPEDSQDPNFLLIKLFCFADKVEISDLQNATLDAIRERATGQNVSPATPRSIWDVAVRPQTFGFAHAPTVEIHGFAESEPTAILEKTTGKYLPPATSGAIHHAYQNTPEASPLRKLLADVFAFNVKLQMLDESLLMLPTEFIADVLTINMRRLPLRLAGETADFDTSADKYHVLDTHYNREPRILERPSNETPKEVAVDNDDGSEGFGTLNIQSSRGKKKRNNPSA